MAFWQWMGFAVAAAILCMVLRVQQPEMARLCALAAGVMLLLSALENLTGLKEILSRLTVLGGMEEGYLQTLVKVLGISYTAEIAAQTCLELGERGLAFQVSLAGKLCVFALTAPLLLEMLEMILELVP